MQFTSKRRLLLGAGLTGLAGTAWLGFGNLGSTTPFAKTNAEKKGNLITQSSTEQKLLLSAIIDTMIPRDNFAGALDAKVDQRIINEMHVNPGIATKLTLASKIISNQSLASHQKPFTDLGVDDREQLLNTLLKQDARKPSIAAVNALRYLCVKYFYQSKQGHQSMGYVLPAHYPSY